MEVRASLLWSAERRMEAETYLHDGFQLRSRLEASPHAWSRLGAVATASAPPRIKQVLVSPGYGVPYLNTSQVFDTRPVPRKWLALGKTKDGAARFVEEGTILVMASATVGRAIVATRAHEGAIISHHFLRVEPEDRSRSGWLYAFLKSRHARAMIDAEQYASVIRHIEPRHLHALPVPEVSDELALRFQAKVEAITSDRNNAAYFRESAETEFANAIGVPKSASDQEFSVQVGALSSGRRRFEAEYHSPRARSIIELFEKHQPLSSLTEKIWWGKRFKRNYGKAGVSYLSADDLFTTNRYYEPRILLKDDDNRADFFVRRGWLLMACSGQTYGLNGSVTIATPSHENVFLSHDLIRIVPKEHVRAGYLLIALTHPTLGRPLLVREAYGMSIPHLDPDDVGCFPVVRLASSMENRIADLAEKSIKEIDKAETLEAEIKEEAGALIDELIN